MPADWAKAPKLDPSSSLTMHLEDKQHGNKDREEIDHGDVVPVPEVGAEVTVLPAEAASESCLKGLAQLQCVVG